MKIINNPDKILLTKLLQGIKVDNHTSGNALAEALNLHIEAISKEKILLKFDVGQQFTQGHGVIQGGIITAMLDFGGAFIGLANVADTKSVVTTNSSINYLRPAPIGIYYVEAKLEKIGEKMIFASANIYQKVTKNIATAIFSMAVI